MNRNTDVGNKFWYIMISLVASAISIIVFITGKNLPDLWKNNRIAFSVTSTGVDHEGINGMVNREGDADICVTVNTSEFIADVIYINPASTPYVPNSGYGFKYTRYYPASKEVQYDTWINWGNKSLHHRSNLQMSESETLATYSLIKFQFSDVAPEENKANHLNIVVTGDNAQLFVNGSPGPTIDLSEDGKFSNASSQSKVCVALVNFIPVGLLESFDIPDDHISAVEFKDFIVK